MPVAPGVIERPDIESVEREARADGWIVTVFNNEYNTYEEVIAVLILATGCTEDEASMEAWEIDRLGKSVVHMGGEKECRCAREIIATIGIQVEVSQE